MKIKLKEWAPWIAILHQYQTPTDLREYIKAVVSDKEGRQFIGLVLECTRWVYRARGKYYLIDSGLCAVNNNKCHRCILYAKIGRECAKQGSIIYENTGGDSMKTTVKRIAREHRNLLLGLYAEEYKRMGL